MRDVVLELGVTAPHVTQVVAGFSLLADAGEVKVRVRRAAPHLVGRDDAVLRAHIDGVKVVFELRDGADVPQADLEWSTVYFKRSYRSEQHADDPRIVPLGLNYGVCDGADWRLRQAAWAFAGMAPRSPMALRNALIRTWWVAKPHRKVARFERPASTSEPATALLMARVWDPRRVEGAKAAAWEELNAVRVGCIQALSAELGDRFFGGLAPSDFARERYPELVLESTRTSRRAYLARVHAADVNVTSRGLRDSNGWRLPEGLAASRAMVSEPLFHEVPGDLGDGHGLVTYTTVDECVAAVVGLLDDADARREVAEAGHAYYQEYVRPDVLVRRALDAVR